ncbi:Phosphatidate cytidylyltransferase, partial [Tolypocladium capitatum]
RLLPSLRAHAAVILERTITRADDPRPSPTSAPQRTHIPSSAAARGPPPRPRGPEHSALAALRGSPSTGCDDLCVHPAPQTRPRHDPASRPRTHTHTHTHTATMGRSRRGVRFPHGAAGNGQASSSDGRHSSFSGSEDGSGSPTRTRARPHGQLAPVQEVCLLDDRLPLPAPRPLEQKQPTAEEEYQKKKANFYTRTFWTFSMLAMFFAALFMGHIYIIAIISAVQIVSFKEVIAIANVPSRARSIRSTKSLNWYWLATTMYFLYGESVIYYFKHIVLVDKVLLPLATHHRFISFILYVFANRRPRAGFVSFVATLQAGHYKFQFTNFAWTHMALYLIVVQAHFVMNNIFEGMIWFFLPAALVITNDIFAYVCGIAFGRTQLIKLSPKKTVEGFVGAWIMTLVFAMLLVNVMIRSKYFICPVNDLGANLFTGLQCDPNPVFIPRTYHLPQFFFLPPTTTFSLTFAPMQLHALVLATFASLIAPFGGFFASGLKRTFKIKDFGDSIPGHGGMTDRMDCQFIMGFFAYMYYHTFIAVYKVTLGSVIETAITSLSPDEQVELVKGMARYLGNQGVVPEQFLQCIDTAMSKR